MKKKLLISISLTSTILFSGCATITTIKQGETQAIHIKSCYPSHQKVMVNDKFITTPATIIVKRSKKDLIIKSLDSNDKKILKPKIRPEFGLNVLNGGIGFIIDYTTGDMWQYDETNVNLNCQK
jgi:uncharacterized protein YceK